MAFNKIFNDPVHGFISITDELIFQVIEHPWFQRLRRIKQLGLTDYIYPGALHTRFHHALGATHLMGMAIGVLRNKGVGISEQEELAAKLAILLHDIGHGPFSHALEGQLTMGRHHEVVSREIMQSLNSEFNGQLTEAIAIFENEHPKPFLHQLVSGQLDVDRMDYLTRDSFFTGVHEGVINYQRIIKMLDVVDEKIVVEAKGIYSIEKFLTARRIMYWQVYLHKAVYCAEQMLMKAVERAKEVESENLQAQPTLSSLLSNDSSKQPLSAFCDVDDYDVITALKTWRNSSDPVLSYLSKGLIDRKLLKTEVSAKPFGQDRINQLRNACSSQFDISEVDANHLVFTDVVSNTAYDADKEEILILDKQKGLAEFSKTSDGWSMGNFQSKVEKHFLCYPRILSK